MAIIYRTDRDRRIAGDTVIARRERFETLHPAAGELMGRFVEAHEALNTKLESLRQETIEDQQSRTLRQQIQKQAAMLYEWSYLQLDAMLTPSWEDPAERISVEDVRDRLFPLGAPSTVARSAQKLFDGLSHLKNALPNEAMPSFPQRFLKALGEKTPALGDAIAAVVKETSETHEVQVEVQALRQRWDITYASLKEVTSAFLRLEGKRDELGAYFRVNLPGPASHNTDAPAEPETPAEPEAPEAPAEG